jgi:hypothetical protein
LKVEGITSKNWKLKELHQKITVELVKHFTMFKVYTLSLTVGSIFYIINCLMFTLLQFSIFRCNSFNFQFLDDSSGISTGDGTHYFYPTTTVTNTGYKWLLFVWCLLPLFCLVNCTLLHKNRGTRRICWFEAWKRNCWLSNKLSQIYGIRNCWLL